MAAAAVACSPDARPGATPDGGADDSGVGARGGAGGKGGVGGKGGAGGQGGSGGTAAMTGGAGGAAQVGGQGGGGMAGAPASGGMPGSGGAMMPPPPPGPVAKPTSPALFPGTAATVTTMVMGDPAPGYFYASSPSGITPVLKAEPLAAGEVGLPAGITHVQRTTATTTTGSALILLGFNFRADDGKKWRWIDATQYPGLTFWVRTSAGTLDVNVTLVDATNITTTDERIGTCAKPTMAECPGVPGKLVSVGPAWTQVKLRWTDFMHGPMDVQGDVNVAQIGRIDLLYVVEAMMAHDFFLTNVRLATAAELM